MCSRDRGREIALRLGLLFQGDSNISFFFCQNISQIFFMKFHNLSHPFFYKLYTFLFQVSPHFELFFFFFLPSPRDYIFSVPYTYHSILTIHIPRYPTKFHLRNKIKKRKPRIQISLPPWTVQPHLASSLQPYGWCFKIQPWTPPKKGQHRAFTPLTVAS